MISKAGTARKPRTAAKAAAKSGKKGRKTAAARKTPARSKPKVKARASSTPASTDSNESSQDATPFFARGLQGNKIAQGWQELLTQLAGKPELMAAAVQRQIEAHNQLFAEFASSMPAAADNESSEQVKKNNSGSKDKAAKADPRFANPMWDTHPFYRYLRNSYDVFSQTLRSLPDQVELDSQQRLAVDMVIEQMTSAMAPSNFAATNPEVVMATLDSNGRNLKDGLANYVSDMQDGQISQTDRDAFAIGRDLAITPGKVILRTSLFELIEYAPTTSKVAAEPLLIVPPCINKYYILDLRPDNSLVKHLISRGLRVFLISWVNAGPEHRMKSWDDYVDDGVIEAAQAVRAITKAKVHTLGYCIGGTLLGCAASVLKSRGENWLASFSMLASFLDFCDTGKVGLFVDESTVASCEKKHSGGSVFPGGDLARTFAFIRPDDLVWPYVVNNYLLGKKPKPFDILFWNADSTNLPGPMYAWYLRHAYLDNDLKSGNTEVCGHKIDFSTINLPGMAVSCASDHIVPWAAAYESARLLGDQIDFVLASSGHVAGIVNPPARKKGKYLQTRSSGLAGSAEQWRSKAVENAGSWWNAYADWLAEHSSKQCAAPKKFGNASYRPLADAPGTYVSAPLPPSASD